MTVRVVVDSTADIPPARARELGITVIPLLVLFGDDEFRDGVDMTDAEFYQRLATGPVMPTTATPPPGLFQQVFRSLIADGATGILAIHIGSELSASYSTSVTAAGEIIKETGVPIEVIDSRTVSAGFGLPAQMLAAEARQGKSLEELVARAHNLLSRTHLIAVLDTLEYLRRGGRIGRAQAMLGTVLNFKPLIEIRDSKVVPLEKVRTRGKALERIGELISQRGEPEAIAIAQSDETIGTRLVEVARTFWNGPIEHCALGPVVGTHAGPGAGAIVVLTRE